MDYPILDDGMGVVVFGCFVDIEDGREEFLVCALLIPTTCEGDELEA
jgi:hypothetical protein